MSLSDYQAVQKRKEPLLLVFYYVHFLNYAARTGSSFESYPSIDKNYNVGHIDTRFVFQSITSTITENEVNSVMEDIVNHALSFDSVTIPGLSK